MDTLTHTVLGATVAHLVAGRRLSRPAILLGALAANAPDLDVFLRFSDPVLTHQLHRHFTHALLMIPVLAALATAPFLLFAQPRAHARWLYLTALLACATHTLLDACTSYGTLLLWPFTTTRISWDLVAVVDPLITLPLLVAAILAVRGHTARVSALALAWVACYLGLAGWQHHRAGVAQQTLAASRGHVPAAARVIPTLGNIILWRSIYQQDHHIQCDAIRLLPATQTRFRPGADVPLVTAADLASAGATPADLDAFRRFAWFADSYVAYAPARPDVLADMRYSLKADAFVPAWGIRLSHSQTPATWIDLATPTSKRNVRTLWRDIFSGKDYQSLSAPGKH